MAPDLACAIGRFQILGVFSYLGRCAIGAVLLGARLCRSWVVWNAEDIFLRMFVGL